MFSTHFRSEAYLSQAPTFLFAWLFLSFECKSNMYVKGILWLSEEKHRLCFVRGVFFTPLLKQQPEICMVWCGEIVIADLGAVSQNDALKRRATWKQSGGSKLGLLHVPDLHNAEQSCKRQDSSRKFRVGGRLWCLSSKFVMPWEVLSRLRIKTTATSPSQNCCQDSSLAQATLHTS